jgi:hypothetical protein
MLCNYLCCQHAMQQTARRRSWGARLRNSTYAHAGICTQHSTAQVLGRLCNMQALQKHIAQHDAGPGARTCAIDISHKRLSPSSRYWSDATSRSRAISAGTSTCTQHASGSRRVGGRCAVLCSLHVTCAHHASSQQPQTRSAVLCCAVVAKHGAACPVLCCAAVVKRETCVPYAVLCCGGATWFCVPCAVLCCDGETWSCVPCAVLCCGGGTWSCVPCAVLCCGGATWFCVPCCKMRLRRQDHVQ